MTTTTFELVLHQHNIKPGTRQSGDELAAVAIQALENHEQVVIDFESARLTPSFVDQGVGLLISCLGWPEFKRRIRLVNVDDASRHLVKHVLARRRAMPAVHAALPA